MQTKYPPDQIIQAISKGECLSYKTVEMGHGWVSDEMQEEVKTWCCTRPGLKAPVLINAPTGLGKNTFVLNNLANHAEKQHMNVLLLCNRYTLNMQQKIMLNNRGDHPPFGTSTIEKSSAFEKNIFILSYHEVPYRLSEIGREKIGFVVFDEAHFFCSDAPFYVKTCNIFRQLLNTFPHAKRIYMSATPEDVRSLIAYEEFQYYQQFRNSSNSVTHLSFILGDKNYCLTEFKFPRDYPFVNLSFFKEWKDIETSIKDSDEKWLIFVGSKEDGKKLQKEMASYSTFIDATYKDLHSENIHKLARQGRFKEKVLIATTVLYNGFSFNDDSLKHIVVDSVDRVEILQMLGRKRAHENEKVYLHVRDKSSDQIIRYKHSCQESYQILDEFKHDLWKFNRTRWGNLTESQQHLFAIENGTICMNPHAPYQLACLIGKYEDLEDRFALEGEEAFKNEVCSWFNIQPTKEIGESLSTKVKEQIIALTEQHIGISKTKDDFENFVNQLMGIIEPIKKEMNAKKNTIRGDTAHSNADTNNVFKFFSLPYECKKSNNLWTINKTTDDQDPSSDSNKKP